MTFERQAVHHYDATLKDLSLHGHPQLILNGRLSALSEANLEICPLHIPHRRKWPTSLWFQRGKVES